jgi:predicted DCC family thiol-disulfide oxidoreductase YuxK
VLFSDQQLYSNHFYLVVLLVGLLTLARPGSALSIDALRGEGRETVPQWPLFLIRAQISIVYLFTGLAKINPSFLSGAVVSESLRNRGPLPVPLEWRVDEVMVAMSVIAIATELFLSVALWVPRLRPIAFVVGLGLHVWIAFWLSPMAPLMVFSLIILSPYILFLDPPPRGAVLVWDASCGFCRGWVGIFRRLDWLHALWIVPSTDVGVLATLRITRDDADRALQLVRDGRRAEGFSAVVGVLELTPIAFLWAPVLRLPPIAWIGDRLYKRAAARRRCPISDGHVEPSASQPEPT